MTTEQIIAALKPTVHYTFTDDKVLILNGPRTHEIALDGNHLRLTTITTNLNWSHGTSKGYLLDFQQVKEILVGYKCIECS